MRNDQFGARSVRWDLASYFYEGISDPQIDLDVKTLIEMEEEFHTTYKGRLPDTLGGALREYIKIRMFSNKLCYIGLLKSLKVSDPKIKAKEAEIEMLMNKASGEYLEFFLLELADLSNEALESWYVFDKLVAKHRPWIEHVRLFRPHMLSESVESALTKRAAFSEGAWSEFHDELIADFEIEFQGEKRILEEMISVMNESQDANVRAEAMNAINVALSGFYAKYSAQALWMTAGASAVENDERKYKHPMQAENMSNGVTDAMVDALHRTIQNVVSPIAKRFYRLKAKYLGLNTLRWSDKNAKMPFSDAAKIPFEEAMKMVISAYAGLSPLLADLVRKMRNEGRIDAPAIKGKTDGAFCTWAVLPDGSTPSFTLLNYSGGGKDVMTLAHEVGHGVHGELAGMAQGELMCDVPTAYAETASVFGEMTTFNFLKAQLLEEGNKESLLALIMAKLDDSLNTMVRQIGFSNFERRLHGMDETFTKWEAPKKRSVEELNAIWKESIQQLYGEDGEIFTYENMEYLWAYVGHFHSPFYVYSYAFGELLTQSLYAVAPRFGEQFESLYLDLLRAGSSKSVEELLAPFGLDPTNEEFWANGVNVGIGALLEEAEALSREMGISI